VGTSAIATETTTKAQVDSLLQAALMQTTAHKSEASVEQTLHLLLFDTTQPADTATGLPPVKAALTTTTTATRKDNTERRAQVDVKAELNRAQTDSTRALAQSTSHVQSYQQANVAAQSDTTDKGKSRSNSWPVLAVAALAALLILTACVWYLRRK
jgi:cobalamin biosynthesis Mg chelatase CobN